MYTTKCLRLSGFKKKGQGYFFFFVKTTGIDVGHRSVKNKKNKKKTTSTQQSVINCGGNEHRYQLLSLSNHVLALRCPEGTHCTFVVNTQLFFVSMHTRTQVCFCFVCLFYYVGVNITLN